MDPEMSFEGLRNKVQDLVDRGPDQDRLTEQMEMLEQAGNSFQKANSSRSNKRTGFFRNSAAQKSAPTQVVGQDNGMSLISNNNVPSADFMDQDASTNASRGLTAFVKNDRSIEFRGKYKKYRRSWWGGPVKDQEYDEMQALDQARNQYQDSSSQQALTHALRKYTDRIGERTQRSWLFWRKPTAQAVEAQEIGKSIPSPDSFNSSQPQQLKGQELREKIKKKYDITRPTSAEPRGLVGKSKQTAENAQAFSDSTAGRRSRRSSYNQNDYSGARTTDPTGFTQMPRSEEYIASQNRLNKTGSHLGEGINKRFEELGRMGNQSSEMENTAEQFNDAIESYIQNQKDRKGWKFW